MLKRYAHAPAHLMMDDTPYFLTGATHGRAPLARGSRDQGRPAGDHHRSLHPVRHGYVADLNRYPYSSFPRLIERQGREALAAQFRAHPEFRALRIDEDDY